MFNLNDIRYFLAVAESGSLSAASRVLGVTQPTVGRRIQDIENALGARLFERSLSGYELNNDGLQILDSAKAIEPHTRLDIFVHNNFLDLLRRQADIALRIGQPGSDLLVGKVACAVNFGLYASNRYIDQRGRLESLDDVHLHRFILGTGGLAKTRQMKLISDVLGDSKQQLYTNSIVAQLSYTKNHLFDLPLWVLTHRELKDNQHIRRVRHFLTDHLGELKAESD